MPTISPIRLRPAVLASIPATEIDYDTIINGVCEKLNAQTAAEAEVAETAEAEGETVEAAAADVQPEEQIAPEDYDIVIDDEGLQRITESISWKVTAATNAKFEEMDGRLGEVKQELADIRAALEKAQEEQPAAEEEQPAPRGCGGRRGRCRRERRRTARGSFRRRDSRDQPQVRRDLLSG